MIYKKKRIFYVYILSSLSGTLYVGVTDNLPLRLLQHRNGTFDGFNGNPRWKDISRDLYGVGRGRSLRSDF